MAKNTYADLFEYNSFCVLMNNCTIEYTKVKLLKDMCGKKIGTEIDNIVLNPATGAFTITRPRRVMPSEATAAKTLVEFKGVHTRFEDKDESLDKDVSLEKPKNKRTTKKPTQKKDETTIFKVYEGRKIHKISGFEDPVYLKVIREIFDILGMTFSNDIRDGCIVLDCVWDEFELKKRYKADKYSFARIY